MTLVVRLDTDEHVLRSIGDHLPGVICAGEVEPCTYGFYVDPSWMPSPAAIAAGRSCAAVAEIVDASDIQTPVGLADVVDGCTSTRELGVVMSIAMTTVHAVATHYLPHLAFEQVAAAADFAAEVRESVRIRAEELARG